MQTNNDDDDDDDRINSELENTFNHSIIYQFKSIANDDATATTNLRSINSVAVSMCGAEFCSTFHTNKTQLAIGAEKCTPMDSTEANLFNDCSVYRLQMCSFLIQFD